MTVKGEMKEVEHILVSSVRYEGIVYRPPSEAKSLILQITVGCSHNNCTFCGMYRGKHFRIRENREILDELDWCAEYYGDGVKRIFFADGDALMVPTPRLLELLCAAKERFPSLERVTAYGSANDVLRKTEAELSDLANAGLAMVYMGAESGDDDILKSINKGCTSEELVQAGLKLKRCGIKNSVTLISGIGGKMGMERHARCSAELVNAMNPDYASFLTLQLVPGTPMNDDVISGRMELLSPDEIMEESRIFLAAINSPGTVFRSNHASNYVPLAGVFNDDIPRLLAELEKAQEERLYRPEWMRGL